MKELIVEILTNTLIQCDATEYHSFVRAALVDQKDFHINGGDTNAVFILQMEIERLDRLHSRLAVAG